MIQEVKKAWMAGIIDGEGCITCAKLRNGKRLAITVTNTDLSILLEFFELYGGGIYQVHKERVSRKSCWEWRISRITLCLKFLQDILPYLISKKDKAANAIKFLEAKS
jgi:hypothetical protein